MTKLKTRLRKLEGAPPARFARYADMTDEQLNQCLWAYVRPLCPKYGISDAPEDFPGVDAVDSILGDNFNPILRELAQCD